MESYGTIITSITICVGALDLLFSVIATKVVVSVRNFKNRQMLEKQLLKHKMNSYQINQNSMHGNFDTNTIDETMSYIDTKT
jgi:hypothetical protein